MWQYAIKIGVTALSVVLVSEAAKRWTLLGAVLASLPLTSLLAMIWLYLDTGDVEKVSALCLGIFWVIIPSLIFFIMFPVLVKYGWPFWPALSVSIASTALGYWGYIEVLDRLGVKI